MNFFKTRKLIVALLLLTSFVPFFAREQHIVSSPLLQVVDMNLDGEEVDLDEPTLLTLEATKPDIKHVVKSAVKVTQEVYANRRAMFLNRNIASDSAFYSRTTVDGSLTTKYGDNQRNPFLDFMMSIRGRYTSGASALVKTAASEATLAGATLSIPSADIQKTLFWLRQLFLKISFDDNSDGSDHYLKFGIFPYELGRGIALGSAYNAGGFLGLTPSFSIDQFAPGILFHSDIIHDTLSGDIYSALLVNSNASFEDNSKIIRLNEIREAGESAARGTGRHVWVVSGALHWKAIDKTDLKLNVDPYAYVYSSPDQKLEFPADSDSDLYAIGSAVEFKSGRFECGFDGAFQGGTTNIKPWDRNYTSLINDEAVVSVQYTKVYQGPELTTLALVTSENKTTVSGSVLDSSQNGQQIGTSDLYNAIDRFRPEQEQLYHGYFFVFDAAFELIDKQLKICSDFGASSGFLSRYDDVASMNPYQQMHQKYNGFVPLQSTYSGKRLQHLVMLNTGIPRFTVQEPLLSLDELHVSSKVTGTVTIIDKFTNLAYTGLGFEYTPAKFSDQKLLIKPVAFYYWMMESPLLADRTPASHALGTTLSLELEATIKECLQCGGYVGWMLPGKQYEQFKGTQLKGGKLGNDNAYMLNFSVTYKF